MGYLRKGDEVLRKKWKRQRQLDRLPAHVRAAMSPAEVHAFLYQDAAALGVRRIGGEDPLRRIEARMEARMGAGAPSEAAPSQSSPARRAGWLRRLFGRS